MKKPSGRRPRRSPGNRPQRRVIRVLAEGKLTEPQYLTLLARRHRRSVSIDVDSKAGGSGPLTLVQRARDQVKASRRRRRSDGADFDEIWCVFDIDEHPNIPQAINEARESGVQTAISSPCFELWLVLHIQDQTAHLERHDVQRLARDLHLVEGKSICSGHAEQLLLANQPAATERAQRLDDRHKGNGSPPETNPSTGVWRLVASIEPGPEQPISR